MGMVVSISLAFVSLEVPRLGVGIWTRTYVSFSEKELLCKMEGICSLKLWKDSSRKPSVPRAFRSYFSDNSSSFLLWFLVYIGFLIQVCFDNFVLFSKLFNLSEFSKFPSIIPYSISNSLKIKNIAHSS